METNEKEHPKLYLSISGPVEKVVTITPRRVKLKGIIGKKITQTVTIMPEQKYPFKVKSTSAKKGTDVSFKLDEIKRGKENKVGYSLLIENKRKKVGRYYDTITLKTDSKVQPEINIRVSGDILLEKPTPSLKTTPKAKTTKKAKKGS